MLSIFLLPFITLCTITIIFAWLYIEYYFDKYGGMKAKIKKYIDQRIKLLVKLDKNNLSRGNLKITKDQDWYKRVIDLLSLKTLTRLKIKLDRRYIDWKAPSLRQLKKSIKNRLHKLKRSNKRNLVIPSFHVTWYNDVICLLSKESLEKVLTRLENKSSLVLIKYYDEC